MLSFEQSKKERILIVDDDPMIRKMLTDVLCAYGYEVDSEPGSCEAMDRLNNYIYHLLLLDVRIPGVPGHDFLRYCKHNFPDMEIIMITGNPELEDAVRTVKDGAFDYLAKPFTNERLVSQARAALAARAKRLATLAPTLPASGNHFSIAESPLPGYRILRTIGKGAMSEVLLAEHDSKQYALKILQRDAIGDLKNSESRMKRFLREADILTQVNHPNIVRIYNAGFSTDGTTPFILMEYVKGQSLTDLIKQNTMDLESKLLVLRQIARALNAVHEMNILHRDVKPGNIMVTSENIVKLTDFGIARISDSSLTMTNELLGSPAYMPPEAFDSDIRLTPASDIFSFGVLAYELITGVKPFRADTMPGLMKEIRESKPPRPDRFVHDLPSTVEDFLARLLKKIPEERYQSMKQIISGINVILSNGQINSLIHQLFKVQKDWAV